MPSLNTPMTDDERKAAAFLKNAIHESGISQVTISQALGCSQGTISQWANSFCRVPAKWAQPLSKLLNVDPVDISPAYKRLHYPEPQPAPEQTQESTTDTVRSTMSLEPGAASQYMSAGPRSPRHCMVI